jgi:DNA-binding LacI/PurR family transcriptional regulator
MSRVTLKQVATQAGVSYQTVSKVLNKQISVSKDTEARIWKSARDLGYRPNLIARSLRTQRSFLIGYSWEPAPPDQANPILDRFLHSMAQSAEDAGYHLLAFPYRPGQEWIESYRALIETNRVDGFVLSSVEYNDPRIHFLKEQGFPFVAFGRSNPGWEFPYVDVDGAAGMRLVVEHLVERGHRRIGVLAWPASSRVGQNRLDGLLAGLESAGIALPEEHLARGEGVFNFGVEAAHCWLDLPADRRPTALIAFNDVMAIGAMHAIQARGLVAGEDVAVTGFDDSPLVQYLKPGLTSVRQPVWEVGEAVMSILLNALDHPENAGNELQHILLEPQLVIRQSSCMRFT